MRHELIKGKHVYTFNGEVVRSSKREYRFALLGASRKALGGAVDGDFHFIGLGNNAANLVSSWKHVMSYMELKVVEIQ